MAEGYTHGRVVHHAAHSSSASSSANDALELHKLIDRTCGKINELKQLIVDECNLLHQEYTDDLMEPILARQDHVIQRAMRCIQAQQKAIINNGESSFGARKHERRNLPLRSVAAEVQKSVVISESKSQPSGFDEPDTSNTIKEKKKWRLGLGKDKKKETIVTKSTSAVNETSLTVAPSVVAQPQPPDIKSFEMNPAWYGSLDRNVVKKKKRPGLDKSRRHTKTVGSMAGLDIVENCEKLKPDEQYEIGLPSVSIHSKSSQPVGLQSPHKHRPPLPSPYHLECQDRPPRPHSKKDSGFGASTIKDQSLKTISPIDPNFGSHMSIPSPIGYNKSSSTVGLASPDWFRSSTMTKMNSLSKSWYETNLDDGNASSQSTLSLSARSALVFSEPPSSVSISGLDSTDGAVSRLYIASPGTDISEKSSKSSDSETRCSFTNESSKPFEMSDYYKYSTKFRSQNPTLVPPENSSSSSKRILSNAYVDTSHPKTGRVVALNVNDELRFATVESTDEKADDANGNYFIQDQQVPKLPPKQHGRAYTNTYNVQHHLVLKHLETVEGNDMAWFLDTDPPTFV